MKNLIFSLGLLLGSALLAQPTTNAPTPTQAQADVVSVYSDAYTSIATNLNPNWGQSGLGQLNANFTVGGGTDNILALLNFNYQGTELTTTDLSLMEFLHIDIWVPTGSTREVKVSPINNGTGAVEVLVAVPVTPGAWNSVDLPKSAFTGMTWDSVFQFKYDGQFDAGGAANTTPHDVYIDNVYFWKSVVNPADDATLSDLQVDGASLTGFSSGVFSYDFEVTPGSTVVPQITMATTTEAGATAVITQAPAIPGDATVVVTSQSTNEMETYTVSFKVNSPAVAPPTPPTRLAANVVSFFSDAYGVQPVDTFSAPWDDSDITDVVIAGDNVKRIDFTNFLGIDFSTQSFDISAMTHFHMDIWSNEDVATKSVSIKAVDFGGTNAETASSILTVTETANGAIPALQQGQWVSIDVPLTAFIGANPYTDFAQLVITSNYDVLFFDNLYFHNTVLNTDELALAKQNLQVYPNPATPGQTVKVKGEVKAMEVYNMAGQRVQGVKGQELNTSSLRSGVYMIKLTEENGNVMFKKLIVK